jgi:hypothetical protein
MKSGPPAVCRPRSWRFPSTAELSWVLIVAHQRAVMSQIACPIRLRPCTTASMCAALAVLLVRWGQINNCLGFFGHVLSTSLIHVDTQALTDYVRRFVSEHSMEKGRLPSVQAASKLFRSLAYENKDRLMAGRNLFCIYFRVEYVVMSYFLAT